MFFNIFTGVLGTVLSVILFSSIFVSEQGFAEKGIDQILNGQVSTGSVNLPELNTGTKPEEKVNHILYSVIEIILGLAGFAAVIFLVIGGARYTMSAGDENMINGARSMILYAILGLVVIIFSYAIVTNLISAIEIMEK